MNVKGYNSATVRSGPGGLLPLRTVDHLSCEPECVGTNYQR